MITRRYEIELNGLPEAFRGCRIVFLTDLHGCRRKGLLERIEAEKPDYVLIGGDMMLGSPEEKSVPKSGLDTAEELVTELARRYPVYYAYGNHECKLHPETMQAYRSRLEAHGVQFLQNAAVALERQGQIVYLHGLCQEREWFPKGRRREYPLETMIEQLGAPSERACHILLAHHPNYFPTYARWGADLVLAGHVHGGVVRLPWIGGVIGPDFLLFPPYSGGLYEREGSRMIVSCGLGAHTIKFRLFNPPELTSIVLK